MKKAVEFQSEGATLRGWFYTPNGPAPYATVVMAHGFTATVQMVADRYAEAFQAAGFAVLLYDHRNIGGSGGEPRQEVNVWVQARGYRDAVTYLHTRSDIALDRIALWGDSNSAMQVTVLGALEPRAAAIVAQIPSCGPQKPDLQPSQEVIRQMRETFDKGDVSGTPETTTGPMPVVSFDQLGSPSHLKPLSAFRWFIEYGGRFQSNWQNVAIRVIPATPVPFSPYLAAPFIKADILFMVAPGDEMVMANPDVARATYDLIPSYKEYQEIPGGHFGLLYYPSELFDRASSVQIDFLVRRLLGKAKTN
jgi:pimeloyl-ACP methyl ester carboxylesterase